MFLINWKGCDLFRFWILLDFYWEKENAEGNWIPKHNATIAVTRKSSFF
jgi:hypothetical protein